MDKRVLDFINKCESWKVEIKELHWASDNMSQHELCDTIASAISDFEDLVSEVEQSISGKIKLNTLSPDKAKETNLKIFVEDVINSSQDFLKELEKMGDKYIGIKSECESFIGVMQRNLYLVNFTLKEELKKRLRAKINESMPKNPMNVGERGFDKFVGRRPKSIKARINQIYKIVKKYGIDSRRYTDEHWQAIEDYYRAITSLGCEVELKPCGHISHADSIESDGGYCDYADDGMPRSKQYAIKIMFDDGMNIEGYIKCMACGTMEDPFSRYDTCMVLWPKSSSLLEGLNEYGDRRETREKMGLAAKRGIMNGNPNVYQNAINSLGKRRSSKDEYNDMQKAFEMDEMRLTEEELKGIIKEAAIKVLTETPLDYDIDNFSGRWTKNMPNDYIDGESEGYFDDPNRKGDIESDLDDYASEEGDMRPMKDIENDYSWGLHDNQPIAQGVESDYYKTTRNGVPHEIDYALRMRNRDNSWTDRELRHGGRVMDKYVHGKYDGEDVGDAWDDLHYESKEPMKVTESEVKELVREAAMQIINEYNQRMANTKNFKRSTHGHRNGFKRDVTPEEKAEARRCLGIKDEVEESIEIDPKNKGKFTATKKATGKSTEELTHSKNPLTRKRANFAKMAKRHWKPLKK